MKKLVSTSLVVAIVIVFVMSISFNIKTAAAMNLEDSDFVINRVDHEIEVLYNGYVFVNDTIRIVGNASSAKFLDRFLVGFPYKYSDHLVRCVAYDSSNTFDVTLNAFLGNHVGFYAVEITFPTPLDISVGKGYIFSVGFVFSNDLVSSSTSEVYVVDFPAYPSLNKTVVACVVSISLPQGAQYSSGTVAGLSYEQANLPAFTYSPANITFKLSGDTMRLVNINELKREVRINEKNEIEGSDSYYITSESTDSISSIEIVLPRNASTVKAQDQFGRTMTEPEITDEKTNRYRVNFTSTLESTLSTRFTVQYVLPSDYITQNAANNFNLTFPLFEYVDYCIESTSVTFILPEGARISSSGDYSISRGVFQETLTLSRTGVSNLEGIFPSESILEMTYEYNPLWMSFRPTLWMLTLALVGYAVFFVGKKSRETARIVMVPTAVAVRLRPEHVKSFVETYEEKKKIDSDLDALESKVQKGKIPRRRYKVQRKTLETRLNTLSRNLTETREKMGAAGGQYLELMRQLEVAETEINEGETNIKSIETRYNRGELSLESYRKLLADYQHRKERANAAINGILLRLREEIR